MGLMVPLPHFADGVSSTESVLACRARRASIFAQARREVAVQAIAHNVLSGRGIHRDDVGGSMTACQVCVSAPERQRWAIDTPSWRSSWCWSAVRQMAGASSQDALTAVIRSWWAEVEISS